MDTKKLLITGGGSGGHLNPALAVISHIQRNKLPFEMVFLGGTRGMIGEKPGTGSIEERKIPETGVRFIGIRSGKFHRKFGLYTLKLLFGVFGGFIDSFRILRAEKPEIVFSTGGYVSFPVVVMAKLLRIRVIIHEQTIISGLANRIAAKFADKILISFPNSAQYFPTKKCVLTGTPIQLSRISENLPENLSEDYEKHLVKFATEKTTKPFLFITGGGLGSHVINRWFLNNIKMLARKYFILIQTGSNQVHKDFEAIANRIVNDKDLKGNVYAVPWFGEEIGFIYSNADLVVARPGANTVIELLANNKKAALIPIPWSSGGEQQLNAEYYISQQNGAIVLQDDIEEELEQALQIITKMDAKDSKSNVPLDSTEKIIEQIFL